MAEIKLKPCPFCGGSARFFFMKAKIGSFDSVGVECIKCGAAPFCVQSMTIVYGERNAKETAAEHWNRRTGDAADVEPVRHGHWINEDFYTRCSVCDEMAIYDMFRQEIESAYCPNCGAIMDELEHDT